MEPITLALGTVAVVALGGWWRTARMLRTPHAQRHDVHRFRTAFERSYDAMVITDSEGTVLFINDAALRINGFERTEVLGTKAGKLWGGLMGEAYYRAMWHRIKVERQPFFGHVTNRRRDGTKYQAAVTISPVELPGTKGMLNFIAVERDLGEPDSPISPRTSG